MPYSTDSGFTPRQFDEIMNAYMNGVNMQFGTKYDAETFKGTNFYKYAYGVVRDCMDAEIAFGEVYEKLKDYIRTVNEKIAVPKTPVEGLIESFKDILGITISVAPQTAENAGTLSVCALLDNTAEDYADKKRQVLTGLKDWTVAGLYYAGAETGDIALSNGQSFAYAFSLPQVKATLLRLTITNSRNTSILVDGDAVIKQKLLTNIKNLYGLGIDFAPERYFTIDRDAPYAAEVLLEYKKAGDADFTSETFHAAFRDLLTFDEDDIEIIKSNA